MSAVLEAPPKADPKAELLGEVISWHSGAPEIAVSDVRQALSDAGIDPDICRDLNNRAAFSRAKNHLKENRSIDKVHETSDGKVKFQLTHKTVKEVSGEKVMEFDLETWITLDTKSGDIHCSDATIEQQARELFAHSMNVRTASDLTRLVQRLFKEHADLFPINPSKGVAYFVPEAHREFTARVERFFTQVGGMIARFPVPKGTEQGNASVRDAVAAGMEALFQEMDESVGSWDEKTRRSTISNQIKKWRTVHHKIESYAEYLQSSVEAITQRSEEVKQRLIDRAMELTDDDDEAPTV